MGPANYAIGPSYRKQLPLLGVGEQKEAVEIIKQIISKMGPLKCGCHLVLVSLSSENGPVRWGHRVLRMGAGGLLLIGCCWSLRRDMSRF